MVASSARQAARLHEDAEGYEEGEARAERVVISLAPTRWGADQLFRLFDEP